MPSIEREGPKTQAPKDFPIDQSVTHKVGRAQQRANVKRQIDVEVHWHTGYRDTATKPTIYKDVYNVRPSDGVLEITVNAEEIICIPIANIWHFNLKIKEIPKIV